MLTQVLASAEAVVPFLAASFLRVASAFSVRGTLKYCIRSRYAGRAEEARFQGAELFTPAPLYFQQERRFEGVGGIPFPPGSSKKNLQRILKKE